VVPGRWTSEATAAALSLLNFGGRFVPGPLQTARCTLSLFVPGQLATSCNTEIQVSGSLGWAAICAVIRGGDGASSTIRRSSGEANCRASSSLPLTLCTRSVLVDGLGAGDNFEPDVAGSTRAPVRHLADRQRTRPGRSVRRGHGPKQTQKLVTPLTDDELRALIGTCGGPAHRADDPLHHRRDEAIIRLMFETGIRIGETIAFQLDDVDLDAGRVTLRRGKGGRGRVIPIGATTSAALRAYLTLRAHHRCADSPELWLGERGTRFGYDGLSRALRRRAQLARIAGFHPHKLRHTAAHRWLAAGGSESGLMAIAGWTRTDMLIRYTPHPTGPRPRPGASTWGSALDPPESSMPMPYSRRGTRGAVEDVDR